MVHLKAAVHFISKKCETNRDRGFETALLFDAFLPKILNIISLRK